MKNGETTSTANTGPVFVAEKVEYCTPVLDTTKITSVEDCANVLKFLCGIHIQPIPSGCTYAGFQEVEKYFNFR
mgnify:FL=1